MHTMHRTLCILKVKTYKVKTKSKVHVSTRIRVHSFHLAQFASPWPRLVWTKCIRAIKTPQRLLHTSIAVRGAVPGGADKRCSSAPYTVSRAILRVSFHQVWLHSCVSGSKGQKASMRVKQRAAHQRAESAGACNGRGSPVIWSHATTVWGECVRVCVLSPSYTSCQWQGHLRLRVPHSTGIHECAPALADGSIGAVQATHNTCPTRP